MSHQKLFLPKTSFPLKISAVGFDLDGTLVETLPDLFTAVNLTLKDLGIELIDRDTCRDHIGRGIEHLLSEVLKKRGIDLSKIDLEGVSPVEVFREHYAAHVCEGSFLFDGIERVLTELADRGLPLACITNKSEMFTLPILKKLGVDKFFSQTICGDTFSRRKPDPMPIRECASRFQVPVEEFLMVGDSQTDTQAARNAGAKIFCVPYGYRSGMRVCDLDCDVLLSHPEDILGLIR
ncbi:MAG: HAD family hydrolase [Burkholderiales bacterium]